MVSPAHDAILISSHMTRMQSGLLKWFLRKRESIQLYEIYIIPARLQHHGANRPCYSYVGR